MPDLTPPPLPRTQRTIDAEHLKLLAIFHFVAAGLALLGVLSLFGLSAMFHAMLANPKMWENQKLGVGPGPSPLEVIRQMFQMFQWFYVVLGGWSLASVVLNLLSGSYLRARKRRIFSMVVAGINCLHVPVGTVLGIFTFSVLGRESVRKVYEE